MNLIKKVVLCLTSILIDIFYILIKPINKIYVGVKNNVYSIYVSKSIKEGKGYFKYPIKLLGGEFISIGKGCSFGKYGVLTCCKSASHGGHPILNIGCYCEFGDFLHLTCANRIIIGNNLQTGRWVTISDNNHGSSCMASLSIPPAKRSIESKGAVIIEDDVWIGDKATILSNVTIGKGSVVAANAVVTKSVPPYSIVAGNPAKVIKSVNK